MNVTTKIRADLTRPGVAEHVYAVQNDRLTHKVQITLSADGQGWAVPGGAAVWIRYAKPDGTGGVYDTLETGASAYLIEDNVVTITLVEQMLTVPGIVPVEVNFYSGNGTNAQKLTTFSFLLFVRASVVTDTTIVSSDYYNILTATAAQVASYAAMIVAAYGAPRVAATAAAMTDHSLIYVYTGSESGYINGNWYYWDGTAWTSGGVYNSVAVTTDTTLSAAGVPADAKAAGDAIRAAGQSITNLATSVTNINNRLVPVEGEAAAMLVDSGAVWADGRWYINSSLNTVVPQAADNKKRAVVPVKGGQSYKITFCSYGSSSNVIIFADIYNTVISTIAGEATRTNVIRYVKTPASAAYLYVMHDTYLEDAVTPKIALVTTTGYTDNAVQGADTFVDYMGAGLKRTDAVSSTSYNGIISSAGVVRKSTSTNAVLYIYPVTAGTQYILYGEGARINSANPIAAFGTTLFDGETDTPTSKTLISGTSDTATDYNVPYTPPSNGYVYIATYGSYPKVVLYGAAYSATRLDGIVGRIDAVPPMIPAAPYDFDLSDVFDRLETTFVDDFTARSAFSDSDYPYVVSGDTSVLPTITTGTGAVRTIEYGTGNALYYTRTFDHFPFYILLGRIPGTNQMIRLYGDKLITISAAGAITLSPSINCGRIHRHAIYTIWQIRQDGVTIVDDMGLCARVPAAYAEGQPLTAAMVFGTSTSAATRTFAYASYVEMTEMPPTTLDFTRWLAANDVSSDMAEHSSIYGALKFAYGVWDTEQDTGVINYTYNTPCIPPFETVESDNDDEPVTEPDTGMWQVTGPSNNPCIKCVADYSADNNMRCEIVIQPIRTDGLYDPTTHLQRPGVLQRIVYSADYYMASEDNPAVTYRTYIFQIRDSGFFYPGWVDGPAMAITILNGRIKVITAFIGDDGPGEPAGAVPGTTGSNPNRHTMVEYDCGEWLMDEWIHIEVESRIGWKPELAPRLVVRINGQERLNVQTAYGFNVCLAAAAAVSEHPGFVQVQTGLYLPQWHHDTYENARREILVTNIRWAGTQSFNG